MCKFQTIAVMVFAAQLGLTASSTIAQQKSGIVCWKDKSGKTVGCGDKVPPEYQDNASRVLNQRGMTVKQTDAALTPEQQQVQAAAVEQKKIDALKQEEMRRRDRALLDSFSTDKEIDLKRARDVQQIELNISTQQTNLKNALDRQRESKGKIDQLKRANQPIPAPVQEDFDRLEGVKAQIQSQILQKRKEIVERNTEYDAMKKRFLELKGLAPTPPAAQPVANAAPVPAPVGSAKK